MTQGLRQVFEAFFSRIAARGPDGMEIALRERVALVYLTWKLSLFERELAWAVPVLFEQTVRSLVQRHFPSLVRSLKKLVKLQEIYWLPGAGREQAFVFMFFADNCCIGTEGCDTLGGALLHQVVNYTAGKIKELTKKGPRLVQAWSFNKSIAIRVVGFLTPLEIEQAVTARGRKTIAELRANLFCRYRQCYLEEVSRLAGREAREAYIGFNIVKDRAVILILFE